MLEDLKKDATQRMQKCVSAFRDQLKKLRTGRAHTSLIEHIKVDYYGSEMPLNQVANIATEDARTLTVSPWEKAMVPVIEKAIYKSDLGLTPNTAGQLIRINMPALTEERRRDIIKVVKSEAENARVAVRGVPRAAGHRASVKVVRKVVEECARHKVRYLTLFAFSSENWRRPPDEVGILMNLFLDALEREVAELHRNQVRLAFIGDRGLLGAELARRMQSAEQLTAANTGLRRSEEHTSELQSLA